MKLFFDTETTGIYNYKAPIKHPSQPHIVQLGALLTDDTGKTKGELNLLIRPNGWTIPSEASAVHGILTEHCQEFGVDIRTALGMFNAWLKMGPLIVAHNLDFDYRMINTEVARLERPPILETVEKYCTMKNSTDLVKIPSARGFKWPKLQETHQFLFGENFADAHDAMADVRACARCYFRMIQDAQSQSLPQPTAG